MRFEFATATRIIFGPGTLSELSTLAKNFGRHALVVTGSDPARAQAALSQLTRANISTTLFHSSGEPEIATVEAGKSLALNKGCDFVISFGGGSAIDAGKAIAAYTANSGSLIDYLEVIGAGRPLTQPSLPFIAIPTTAGTGSEVTRNAVIYSPAHKVKVSLRSAHMLARLAIVDPDLTLALPPAVTASSGMDALTQLIEPYLSCRATPLTDALCVQGISRAARSLRRVFLDGTDRGARTDMALASLYGGLALANAGLGAVHGFAGPIGGMFNAPHGAVCAALLPATFAVNWRAAATRGTDALRERFKEVARLLIGTREASPETAAAWLQQLCLDLKIPGLAAYGIAPAHVQDVLNKARVASSMKANPLPLQDEELTEIFQLSLGQAGR